MDTILTVLGGHILLAFKTHSVMVMYSYKDMNVSLISFKKQLQLKESRGLMTRLERWMFFTTTSIFILLQTTNITKFCL